MSRILVVLLVFGPVDPELGWGPGLAGRADGLLTDASTARNLPGGLLLSVPVVACCALLAWSLLRMSLRRRAGLAASLAVLCGVFVLSVALALAASRFLPVFEIGPGLLTPSDFGEAYSEACAVLRFGLVACGLSVLGGRLAAGHRVRDP